MTTELRAAVVQTLASLGDLDENIRLMEQYTEEAVRQKARLVVFPECMNTGYLFDSQEHCAELAEPITGRYVAAMAALCKKHNIFIAKKTQPPVKSSIRASCWTRLERSLSITTNNFWQPMTRIGSSSAKTAVRSWTPNWAESGF